MSDRKLWGTGVRQLPSGSSGDDEHHHRPHSQLWELLDERRASLSAAAVRRRARCAVLSQQVGEAFV